MTAHDPKKILNEIDALFAPFTTPKSHTSIIPGNGAQLHSLPNRPTFMVQADVAKVYGVKTHELNQARRRNPKKFEAGVDYFQLDKSDITNCDIAYNGGHLPYAYTRRGAYMFATILQTDEAVEQAIQIVEGFMAFERILEQKQAQQPQPVPALKPPVKMVPLPDDSLIIKKDRMLELQDMEIETLKGKDTRQPVSQEMKRQIIRHHLDGKKPAEIREITGRNANTINTQIRSFIAGRLRIDGSKA